MLLINCHVLITQSSREWVEQAERAEREMMLGLKRGASYAIFDADDDVCTGAAAADVTDSGRKQALGTPLSTIYTNSVAIFATGCAIG